MIGAFVDIPNLYFCINKRFPDNKLNYEKYFNKIKEMGDIHCAIAYGYNEKEEANNFSIFLQRIGFHVKFNKDKNGIWVANLIMDIVKNSPKINKIVLGSASPMYVPVVDWAVEHGIKVVTFACGINRELKNLSQYIEIGQSYLLQKETENGTESNEPDSDGVVSDEAAG